MVKKTKFIKISSATCPLFRCKSARTTNFSSCGIGLSLCNSIYVPHLPSPATANLLALRLPGSVCLAATVPQHSMFQNISGHTMGVRKTIINIISIAKDRIWQVSLPASYENTIVCSGWNIDIQSAFRRHGENAQPKCSTWAHCCNSSAAHPLVGLLVDAYTSAKVGLLEVAILPVVSVGVWNDIVWCLLQSCGHALLTSPFILSHLATCGRSWEKSCRHLASPLEQKPPRKLQRKSPPRKF